MDIEGFVRDKLAKQDNSTNKSEKSLENLLANIIMEYKDITHENAILMAQSVIDEVQTTLKIEKSNDLFLKDIINIPKSEIAMGEMGVGSRGAGDFFVHRKIAEIVASTKSSSLVNPEAQDDGGVVKSPVSGSKDDEDVYITTAVDGIHSRLSEYPFLGGFHVARASLRDVCVMGAEPVAIISDLHLADDGDVGKLFDFTAGVATVSELIDVPIVAGSTLRVGGDMVLGDRLVSAVGSIGVSKYPPTARKRAESGDVILLTEGSGGGTITTTAIYNGFFDVVWETMDIGFIKASNALVKDDLVKDVHAMTDVTNGGLRGDAHEISSTTGLGLEFYQDNIRNMVTPKVLSMLETLEIDPLGVSIDSLMIVAPEDVAKKVKNSVKSVGVKIAEIGTVDNTGVPRMISSDGKEEILEPLFREAAYTKIKKLVGETTPEDFEIMKEKVQKAADNSIKKKEKVIDYIKNNP
ncbi:hydrogenase maturation factor [Methanobrevibacter arboriphilus JCM 13429 = DSM 1125]|uniref:Hydrogenase maturation factor n=1 Tax=Methanobrevibacter arboriphilus JCM 13429 = DSM 1125 TaxID=1300164 RepID=A0A1V6N0U1_METAZ|nr:AIR synthase-related protein [Methanobrevibacter arboriphilus]OQD58207.1 hydrogenase maturation factor [Methanobrevibacter arboriphilus JCM 13429 = DSM 1125]